MKLDAARQPFSITLIGSGLLLALFAARYFIAPYPIETPAATGMPLAAWLTRFSTANPRWSAAITLVLVMWISYIMIQLTVRYASATSRNYLPIPIFIITACGLFIPGETLAAYTAALLLILAIRQFISAFRKDYRFEEAFRGGLYIGLIPLLYAPAAVLLLLVPVLMSLYRRSSRELAVSLIGAVLPTLGAWFILWVSGEGVWFLFTEFWRSVSVRTIAWPPPFSIIFYICAGLAAVLVFTAIFWFVGNRKGMRTRQRKVMAHISLSFALIALSLGAPGSSLSVLPLLSIPAAMAIPYAFTDRQAALSTLAYYLLLLAVLALNLSPILGISIP